MTDTNVFATPDTTGNSGVTTSTTGDQPKYDFVGEGKQYATTDIALAAIPHKDDHIAKIEQENSEMRAKLAEGKTLDDVITAMNTGRTDDAGTTQTAVANTPSSPEIAELVRGVLQEERDEASVKANVADANAFMLSTFGDKAQDVSANKAKELGMSVDDLKGLAIRSPAAFKALFIQKQGDTSTHSTQGDVNTQALTDSSATGQSKYDNLRKADQAKFLSPAVQAAQMKEAMDDPAKYFNN